MRKLAQKFGLGWFLISAIPIGAFVDSPLNVLFILIQLFGLIMVIKYPSEIFNQ